MFGKKKKRKIINDVFGEMEYWDGWFSASKIEMVLWNKVYHIELFAMTITENDEINEKQETAYKSFIESKQERQKDIERIIEKHYQIKDVQVLTSKFTPVQLLFSRNGNYGLYVDDNDEICGPYEDNPNMGLAIGIIPELKIYMKEEYDSYLFGE